MKPRRTPSRPQAGLILTLAAVAGIVFGVCGDLFDAAMGHTEDHPKMLNKNQELLYGLRKAIETVEACDKQGVQLATIALDGANPTFTIGTTPGIMGGPELPFTSKPSALRSFITRRGE